MKGFQRAWLDLKLAYRKAFDEQRRETEIMKLTDKDYLDLLYLCHPDKHNGCKRSQKMIRKLNLMRSINREKK